MENRGSKMARYGQGPLSSILDLPSSFFLVPLVAEDKKGGNKLCLKLGSLFSQE